MQSGQWGYGELAGGGAGGGDHHWDAVAHGGVGGRGGGILSDQQHGAEYVAEPERWIAPLHDHCCEYGRDDGRECDSEVERRWITVLSGPSDHREPAVCHSCRWVIGPMDSDASVASPDSSSMR